LSRLYRESAVPRQGERKTGKKLEIARKFAATNHESMGLRRFGPELIDCFKAVLYSPAQPLEAANSTIRGSSAPQRNN
jgi:hypothetical protein